MKYKNSPIMDSTEALLLINSMLKDHNSLTFTLAKYKLYKTVHAFNVQNNKILNEMNKHYFFHKKSTTLDKPLPDFFHNNRYLRIDHARNLIIVTQ